MQSRLRRLTLSIGLIAITGLLVGASSELLATHGGLSGHGKPMTIIYVFGPLSSQDRYYTIYYRSDGSSVFEYGRRTETKSSSFPHFRYIDFPKQLHRVTIDSETNSILTQKVPASGFEPELRSSLIDWTLACKRASAALFPAAIERTCERARDPLLGYRVWNVRLKLAKTPQEIIIQAVLAPSLDWHMLQRTTLRGQQVLGKVSAVRVIEGDPPQNLFEIPKGSGDRRT